jgi:hypothetical protein
LLFYNISNKWVQKKPHTIAGHVLNNLLTAWETDMKFFLLPLLQFTSDKDARNIRE